MRTIVTDEGNISLYDENLGAPGLSVDRFYIPLVDVNHRRASRIRVFDPNGHQYALAFDLGINLAKVIVQPFRDSRGNIVFPHADGSVAFTIPLL